MKIVRSPRQMFVLSRRFLCQGKQIGFVPTMGALHQGHLSLIQSSRKENDVVIVSIFVNPAQFGPKEDLKKYPSNLKEDIFLCKEEAVDILFCPARRQMYPKGYGTYVCPESLGDLLCGRFRPGHFRGVATIVTKLLNIVQPDSAYFGQKDAQQAQVIKRMVADLNIPVKIKVMPTVREKDGLAMSSRNIYLDPQERQDAVVLRQALVLAKKMIRDGNRDPVDIARSIKQLINKKKNARVQYISIVGPRDLRPVQRIKSKALVALAVYIGKTRLIDNIILKP